MTFLRTRFALAALAAAISIFPLAAQAKHHHANHHHQARIAVSAPSCGFDRHGVSLCPGMAQEAGLQPRQEGRQRVPGVRTARYGGEGISRNPGRSVGESYLPHPAGCPPVEFCACGASVEIFGRSIRSLWPARAWYRFPRSYPASGMVAVRSHHVFVLREHVDGSIWLTADYNSGGHLSRLHAQSIAGYVIVDPHGMRLASR